MNNLQIRRNYIGIIIFRVEDKLFFTLIKKLLNFEVKEIWKIISGRFNLLLILTNSWVKNMKKERFKNSQRRFK